MLQSLPGPLAALGRYRQFILYRLVPKPDGGMDKLPVCPHTLRVDSAHNPAIWVDAVTACRAATAMGHPYGVGFVLTDQDPFWLLDIDHCRQGNAWTPTAVELCQRLAGAAVEVSQSGEGLHIIGSGSIPPHGCDNKALGTQLYSSGRFIALTGLGVVGDAATDLTGAITALVTEHFPPKAAIVDDAWTTEPCAEWSGPEDDEELISLAVNAASSAAAFKLRAGFRDLWTADAAALGRQWPDDHGRREYDASSADMALAQHLAFWTGKDCARIERIMRQSALCREKWDRRPEYLQRTILQAVAQQEKVCQRRALVQSTPVPEGEGMGEGLTIGAGWEFYHVGWPDAKSNGKPKGTFVNFMHLINMAGIKCRYNIMSKEAEITIPGASFLIDNWSNNSFALLTALCVQVEFPVNHLERFVLLAADQHAYHPAIQWVESKPWDGVDRIPALVDTLDAQDRDAATMMVRKWLATAIEALYRPQGVAAAGMLVLQGEQYRGKTAWFWSLLGGNRNLGKEGVTLNPSDRDSVKQAVKYWIVELGEIDATFRRSEQEELKAFITRDFDEFRAPYAARESKYPRKTVFFGSVNPREYLRDPTGNRRFWTIPVGPRMQPMHDVDVQQVWAQMLATRGETPIWLSSEELGIINAINHEFETTSAIVDLMQSHYDLNAPRTRTMTVTEILREIGADPTRNVTSRVGSDIAKALGVEGWRRSNGRKVYDMPPLRDPLAEALLTTQQCRAPERL